MIITSSEEDGDCDWGVRGGFWGANSVLLLKQNQQLTFVMNV